MPPRELLIFLTLSVIAAGIVLGTVTVYQHSRNAAPSAPAVHVESNKPNGQTTVDVLFAHVEEGAGFTKVETPAANIEVSKAPAN